MSEANAPLNGQFVFDDDDELVRTLNDKVSVVTVGNDERFASRGGDGRMILRAERAAKIRFAKYQFCETDQNGKTKRTYPGLSTWLKHPDHKEYDRLVFKPARDKEALAELNAEFPDELNLFDGWGVEPKQGDWSLMQAHLHDIICNGNDDHYEYVLDWASQMFCQPDEKSGVAVALLGPEGIGKSKYAQWLKRIIGHRNARTISDPKHIVGDFNSTVGHTLLVVIEEAGIPAQYRARIADLITNPDVQIVRKGIDAEETVSITRFLICADPEQIGTSIVPVRGGDRRFFITKLNDKYKENKAYFKAIEKQMRNGGAEAMLFDLLARNARMEDMSKPPMTDAKRQHIRDNMRPAEDWLFDVLQYGHFPVGNPDRTPEVWEEEGCDVLKSDVAESFRDAVPGERGGRSTATRAGDFLRKNIPGITTYRDWNGSRAYHYLLPTLAAARAAFLKRFPGLSFDSIPTNEKPVAAANENKAA